MCPLLVELLHFGGPGYVIDCRIIDILEGRSTYAGIIDEKQENADFASPVAQFHKSKVYQIGLHLLSPAVSSQIRSHAPSGEESWVFQSS